MAPLILATCLDCLLSKKKKKKKSLKESQTLKDVFMLHSHTTVKSQKMIMFYRN